MRDENPPENPLNEPRVVPAHVCATFYPLMRSLCNLLNRARVIVYERGPQTPADSVNKITYVLQLMFDIMNLTHDPAWQAHLVKQNIPNMRGACDRETWQLLCGTTHPVPEDLILSFAREINALAAWLP